MTSHSRTNQTTLGPQCGLNALQTRNVSDDAMHRSCSVSLVVGDPKPALLIVAHGERGGAGNDLMVHALVERLQNSAQYKLVQCCFIGKEPTLRRTFSDLPPGPVLIYPLFMSHGYFVKHAIPRSLDRIGDSSVDNPHLIETLPPFGLNSQLPVFVNQLAGEAAHRGGLTANNCHLLLVAHGSIHDSASRDAAQLVAARLARASEFAGIELAFLEECPVLADKLDEIEGPVVVVGLFIGEGMHRTVDVPEAISRSRRRDVVLSSPMAAHPELLDVICKDLDGQCQRNLKWSTKCRRSLDFIQQVDAIRPAQ